MSPRSSLRIGIIGAGANTRNMHIPGFHKIEGVELASVANRSVESAKKVARQDGIKKVAADWREIVEDPSIDAICIGTWPNLHAEATIAALENSKHVLCEARMARNLEEARRMEAAARAHPDLVAQIVPAPFSLDFDSTIRELVVDGSLGDLLEIRIVHTAAHQAPAEAPMTWRQDRTLSGNNVLTMGILHETVLRWMDEDPRWIIADGQVFTKYRLYPGAREATKVEIPESLSILGRFGKSGARMSYHFSAVESGKPRMELRLNGSKAALRFDAERKALFFAKAGTAVEKKITLSRAKSRGWQVEADFVNSIRKGTPVERTSFADGLRYMTFTEMVNDSLAGGAARKDWESYVKAES